MERRFQLHHHLADQKFVLIREGDDWRQEFDSLEDAMKAAASLANGSVPLLELGTEGEVVSERSISTANYRGCDESAAQ